MLLDFCHLFSGIAGKHSSYWCNCNDSIEGKKYLDTNTEIVIDWFFLFRKELSIACQCRNIQRVNDKNFFRKSLLETIMYCPFADS